MTKSWSLAPLVEQHAREHPERTLAIVGERSWTYGAVDLQASALATALGEMGLGAGDRIAVNVPNAVEWVISLLACAKLGAAVVPINPKLNIHELRFQLRHAEASAVITVDTLETVDFLHVFEELLGELPHLQYLVTVGQQDTWYDDRVFQFDALIAANLEQVAERPSVSDDADLAVLYTSGTMGKPKGVRLSHRAVVENATHTGAILGVTSDDRLLPMVPFFNIMGFSVMVSALVAGAALVMQPMFDAERTLKLIHQHRATVLYGVPTMFHLLLREDSFKPSLLSSLRTGVIAGSAVADDLVKRVRQWCDVLVAYGLTETGPTVTITRFDDDEERRMFSVGRALPGVEVMAADLITGALHGPEAVGEIAVRGPGLMQGYLRAPSETAKVHTPDGFFLTGDLGIIDEDGYVKIIGRRQETISRGGHQIYPGEVEDRLRGHPAVDDVCVIGVPNDVLGELVCACVVPIEGAVITGREIRLFAQDAMAEYKIPDIVRFFDEFPLTGSGKVRRKELSRAIALEHTASYPIGHAQ
ncbi:MAG: class I adenylate-forming enzyme family protein [Gemmatimonadaceae bacterium]